MYDLSILVKPSTDSSPCLYPSVLPYRYQPLLHVVSEVYNPTQGEGVSTWSSPPHPGDCERLTDSSYELPVNEERCKRPIRARAR